MTGGGFGGACVAVMPAARIDKVRAAVSDAYKTPEGESPLIMVERPGPGVAIL
jgi:galactokinase